VGELITVHEYWGNFAGTSKLAKLYPSGRLIVCEPYYSEGDESDETCHSCVNSDEQE
jgi:regulator of replication initiation timing